ncbi:hypothetical protein M758_10G001000 [Ceratodon purpureus]|uniref:Myb-like domain-containing protein n=1 Tax=Ceratodon purpureus TaxID=3225 RepID=A0A8T0GGB2_CERPU|nr:hypothetical protein KC19_10G001000 [Ceratodon purpureus]KAG0602239.1 hypothetical protein M758_10G001000 [Ceratodon purpureus]
MMTGPHPMFRATTTIPNTTKTLLMPFPSAPELTIRLPTCLSISLKRSCRNPTKRIISRTLMMRKSIASSLLLCRRRSERRRTTPRGRKRKRGRRPVTREKRRKRKSLQNKVVRAGFAKAPLRPLLPYSGNSSGEGSRFLAGSASRLWMGSAKKQPSCYGFTAHQIGQLYSLMHEHVQLLLQVYAMCILEPSMQQVAIDTRRMLMELVEKREAVLSWKKSAFPDFCFRPPYIHPSVTEDEVSSFQHLSSETPDVVKSRVGATSPRVISSSVSHQPGISTETSAPLDSNSTSVINVQSVSSNQLCSPYITRTPAASSSLLPRFSLQTQSYEVVGSPAQVNNAGSASALKMAPSSGQAKAMDNACGCELALSSSSGFLEWVPATAGPVRSLLDVAPLALVRKFTEVVDQVVQASEQQLIPEYSREPLFAVRVQVSQIPKSACGRVKAHPSPNMKRTKAAALVESSKKQTIVLVPKGIAAAMERFAPLFNKRLLPHIAPPASAVNRLLFTDAEDELLAMGLMIYNNDWKAIRERFLPSKSTHQIFVRQKNRSSAKAPPNSIKAVRRMKSSPLTADEIACIDEALKVYKYDWNKVCHHCVPHRDPATLPRQWRIALGTQTSNKPSLNNKENRKLHDSGQHQGFAATSQICPSVRIVHSEPCEAGSCGGHCELENSESHRKFLGDLCTSPATSHLSSGIPSASDPVRSSATTSSRQGQINGNTPSLCSGTLGTQLKSSKRVNSNVHSSPSTYTFSLKDNQTVKLAPGLPLLKLPPTVRVLSHSDTVLSEIPSLHTSDVKIGSQCSTT